MGYDDKGNSSPNLDWWSDEEAIAGQRFATAFGCFSALRTMQSPRVYAGLLYEATYEQRNMFSSDAAVSNLFPHMGFGPWSSRVEVNLLTYNAMQVGFDTLVSKLTQADSRIEFLTDGGNWQARKKAQQLEKLCKGEFYRLDFYEHKQEIELDMLLHGRGYLKFYIDHTTKAPAIERVHPLDIFFDELEARDNPPQTMYQVRIVSKATLKAQYPEYAEHIDAAQMSGDSHVYSTRGINISQMCEVLECWRLPSVEGAGDGRHGLFLINCTLEYGEWTEMDFPFATMTWCKRRRGPYPVPAAEQVIFLQRNLNRLIQREHECIYMLSAPYMLLPESNQVDPNNFATDVGNMVPYHDGSGAKPELVTNKVVPDDIRVSIAQLKRDISDILGITGLESVGEKPAGLDSQPALQEFTEQTSLRHEKTLKENERFVLRAGMKLLTTIRQIKELYGDYAAFGQGRREVEEIKFTDADLPPNAYRMQLANANILPTTPAGRLNRITQLAGTGAFSPKEIIRMFQSPDIEAIMDDETSSIEDIEWTIYELTRPGGKYLPPTEFQDLQIGIEKVNAALLKETRLGAPDEIIEKLDRWIAEALVMQQNQQAAMLKQQMQQQQAIQPTPADPNNPNASMNAPPAAPSANSPGLPPGGMGGPAQK